MIPEHLHLRRRPLFTPIWLAAIGAFLGLIVLGSATWVWATADSTTVALVCPAETRSDAGADPPLAPEGDARAASLARLFGGSSGSDHIDAIYVSAAVRSRMTAAPLAARLRLLPIVASDDAPELLARRALREHAGGRILIVAQANTLNDIIVALGARTQSGRMADPTFGAMYIVSVPRIGRVNVLSLSY